MVDLVVKVTVTLSTVENPVDCFLYLLKDCSCFWPDHFYTGWFDKLTGNSV